jgi:hypothetical protein
MNYGKKNFLKNDNRVELSRRNLTRNLLPYINERDSDTWNFTTSGAGFYNSFRDNCIAYFPSCFDNIQYYPFRFKVPL